MKKKLLSIIFCILCSSVLCMFAEEPPISGGGWHWDTGVNLKGKLFFDVAETYREQDGWAFIEGVGKIHYWLYDTYTYHDGYGNAIVDRYVPTWIESMGFVIDFDHMERVNPNPDLASSVKALMKQRGCDISVAIIITPTYSYVVINNYDKSANSYWTDIIPLIR